MGAAIKSNLFVYLVKFVFTVVDAVNGRHMFMFASKHWSPSDGDGRVKLLPRKLATSGLFAPKVTSDVSQAI